MSRQVTYKIKFKQCICMSSQVKAKVKITVNKYVRSGHIKKKFLTVV